MKIRRSLNIVGIVLGILFCLIIINLNYVNIHLTSKVLVNKKSPLPVEDFNVWLIFTKVAYKSPLTRRFADLIHNLVNISTVPLKFHIIVDEKSNRIASDKLSEVINKKDNNKTTAFTFYYIQDAAKQIPDIVDVMTPFFSSEPGSYYSDALFYLSLGLYRIAPISQKNAVLLDCDLLFKKDILLLFNEFKRFKPRAIFGLAPELTPVYRHVLHVYRNKRNTTFGDYYHDNSISPYKTHPQGFQGYNSGVVLINFERQRQSEEFENVISKESVKHLTEKYKFRGHLGDQDFYTLLGWEYPHLIQTLNCGFNRQLCTWWRDHGYKEVFHNYFKCNHSVVVLHGNCNTKIPKD